MDWLFLEVPGMGVQIQVNKIKAFDWPVAIQIQQLLADTETWTG